MVKRGVVFDLDGTLVDSYQAIALSLNAARAHFGLEALAAGEIRAMVGWGLEVLLERNLGAARVSEAVAVFRARYAQVFREHTRLLPHVAETVAALAERGYRLGVATNKPEVFSRELVAMLGLGRSIAAVRGATPGARLKPEPDLLLAALGDLGLAPGDAVYVGDMGVDVDTGRRAGVEVWVVATGSSSRAELEVSGAARVLDSFAELLDRLGRPAAT